MKSVSGVVDQKMKEANAYADATRDDLEKVHLLSHFYFFSLPAIFECIRMKSRLRDSKF